MEIGALGKLFKKREQVGKIFTKNCEIHFTQWKASHCEVKQTLGDAYEQVVEIAYQAFSGFAYESARDGAQWSSASELASCIVNAAIVLLAPPKPKGLASKSKNSEASTPAFDLERDLALGANSLADSQDRLEKLMSRLTESSSSIKDALPITIWRVEAADSLLRQAFADFKTLSLYWGGVPAIEKFVLDDLQNLLGKPKAREVLSALEADLRAAKLQPTNKIGRWFDRARKVKIRQSPYKLKQPALKPRRSGTKRTALLEN